MDFQQFRTFLEENDWSQKDFAKLMDVTTKTVNLWATGERMVPGPVAAYLRVYQLLPHPLKEREKMLVKTESPGMREGIYLVEIEGTTGKSQAFLTFHEGKIHGADTGKAVYSGYYASADNEEFVSLKLRVTMPKNGESILGIPPQPFEYVISVEATFSHKAQIMSVPVNLQIDLDNVPPPKASIKLLKEISE
jgi:transcriptional regulator with XRE-family HTH domain